MTVSEYTAKLRKEAQELRSYWLLTIGGTITNERTAEVLDRIANELDSGILDLPEQGREGSSVWPTKD